MSIKAVVFDRDGTLIEHVPYLHDPRNVRLLPGVKEGLCALRSAGVMLCVHTNQSGVGRGMFPLSDVEKCNSEMVRQLGLGEHIFDRICIAPESPDQPVLYRKPSPKFALEICAETGMLPSEICYVGDRGCDVETALSANSLAIGLRTGLNNIDAEIDHLNVKQTVPVFDSFAECVTQIMVWLNASRRRVANRRLV